MGFSQLLLRCDDTPDIGETYLARPFLSMLRRKIGRKLSVKYIGSPRLKSLSLPSKVSMANTCLFVFLQPYAREQVDRPLKLPISTIIDLSGRDLAALNSQRSCTGDIKK